VLEIGGDGKWIVGKRCREKKLGILAEFWILYLEGCNKY
jgi:hypothetical protein